MKFTGSTCTPEMIVTQSGRSRSSRCGFTRRMNAFPHSDASCSIRANSSPVVPFGHGFSSSVNAGDP